MKKYKVEFRFVLQLIILTTTALVIASMMN